MMLSAPASMAEYPRNCKVHYFDEAQLGGVAVVIRERAELAVRRAPRWLAVRLLHTPFAVDPSICARELLRSM